MHLRALPEDHREPFRETVLYAFTPEDGPDWDPPDEELLWPDLFTPLGYYDAPRDEAVAPDDLAAVCSYYDFDARVRGEWHRCPGVSTVATPPERRRQGVVAAMLDDLLSRFRADGVDLCALWPFDYDFYRRFGWATCGDYARLTVPVEQLSARAPAAAGTVERLDPDEDLDEVAAVYEAWATEDLAVRRTEGWWRRRVFRGWKQDPYVYGWRDSEARSASETRTGSGAAREREDSGARADAPLGGYVVYTVEDREDGDGRVMAVSELAAADQQAHDQLLRFCHNHDSQVESIRFDRLPPWVRPFDDYPDPRAADLKIHPGPMVRAVDVRRALEGLDYGDATGTATLAVSDDRCPWNDGTVRVQVTDGTATCRPADGADADARLDVGALSQLLVGARTPAELARTDGLTGADAETTATLERLFPERRPFLREGF
jgi:predicted acetyltransferase